MEPVNEPFGNTAKLDEIRDDIKDITSLTAKSVWIERCRILLSEIDYWKGYGEESLRIEQELRDRLQSIQQERDKLEQERDRKHQLFLMKSEECQNKLVTIETMKSRAIRAEQQVNTLTEAIEDIEMIAEEALHCDFALKKNWSNKMKQIVNRIQSIKESPREEQGK